VASKDNSAVYAAKKREEDKKKGEIMRWVSSSLRYLNIYYLNFVNVKKTYISQMSPASTFFTAFSKEYLLFMTQRVCLVG
jgi:hypothetical protein